MAEENENALKHQFGKELLARIASSIGEVHEDFDRQQYLSLAPSLKPLAMKARVRFLRTNSQNFFRLISPQLSRS